MFINYCVFFEDFEIFQTLAFLCFPSVSVCVHQICSRTGRFQKNSKILRKNTIINEHPVYYTYMSFGKFCPIRRFRIFSGVRIFYKSCKNETNNPIVKERGGSKIINQTYTWVLLQLSRNTNPSNCRYSRKKSQPTFWENLPKVRRPPPPYSGSPRLIDVMNTYNNTSKILFYIVLIYELLTPMTYWIPGNVCTTQSTHSCYLETRSESRSHEKNVWTRSKILYNVG